MKFKSYQIILFFALLISCTSAYITVSGLADIYKNAGYFTVLLIAASIESTRISSIYFISLFWNQLGKIFKYIGCIFITCACLISATGVSGFFFSAFQDSQNQVSTLEISQNTNNALIANLQDQIKSEQENIRILQTQLNAEVDVYNNLKNNAVDGSLTKQQSNSLSRKRSIQNQIANSNKEIKKLNEEIVKQTKDSGESQKAIIEAAPELARLKSISSMFGLASEKILLYILTLLIILCFDPFGIYLLILSNKVKKFNQNNESNKVREKEEAKIENKITKKDIKNNIEEIGIKDYNLIKEPIIKKIFKRKNKDIKDSIKELKKETIILKENNKKKKEKSRKNKRFIFSGAKKYYLKKKAFE